MLNKPLVAVDEEAVTKKRVSQRGLWENIGFAEASPQTLFSKVQIFISQSTDFTSFRFISQSAISPLSSYFRDCSHAARGVLMVQSILVYYDSARLMQNLILLLFLLFFFIDSARQVQNLILLLFLFFFFH